MSNAYDKNGRIVNVGTVGHIDHGSSARRLLSSASQLLKQEEHTKMHTPIVNNERKIGRNEPCPCGSGYKFKKCHG